MPLGRSYTAELRVSNPPSAEMAIFKVSIAGGRESVCGEGHETWPFSTWERPCCMMPLSACPCSPSLQIKTTHQEWFVVKPHLQFIEPGQTKSVNSESRTSGGDREQPPARMTRRPFFAAAGSWLSWLTEQLGRPFLLLASQAAERLPAISAARGWREEDTALCGAAWSLG